jgi:hypothetical protein
MNRNIALATAVALAFTYAAKAQAAAVAVPKVSPTSQRPVVGRHSIEFIVLTAGEHQVQPESIMRWRGDAAAYRALLKMLAGDPQDAQVWRNALKAIAVVASGNNQFAQSTLNELRQFVFADNRFNSSTQSAFGTPSEPKKFADAAFFAKRAIPEVCGILARYAPANSAVAANAIDFLEQGSDPKYWHDSRFQWPPDDFYSTPTDRSEDMAVLSVRSLRDTVCSAAAHNALDEITKRIRTQKNPTTGWLSPDLYTIHQELMAPSLGCH